MSNQFQKFKTRKAFNTPFEAHSLTFQCYKNKSFLLADRTREYFRSAVNKARERHGFHLWAYVWMPNHVHMLIWFPHGNYSIPETLRSIKQSVSRRALIYLRQHNPKGLKRLATGNTKRPYRFWQEGGGYDLNLHSSNKIWGHIEYIHENPVRKHLVGYETDWEWSIASDWILQKPGPVPIDKSSVPFA